MAHRQKTIDDIVPFSDSVDQTRVPKANGFLIERHKPTLFDTPYHHHTSVELNFLQGCDMSYSFSGEVVDLQRDRISVFWGAAPHRVIRVSGDGIITNIYLSLGQFVRWGLPDQLLEAVLSGAVISTKHADPMDKMLINRLFSERGQDDTAWRRTHMSEIETRLRRVALEGWTTLLASRTRPTDLEISAQTMMHVETMLRFIADSFTIPINVGDIADAANLSPVRAGQVFRKVMGIGLKQQLMRARLSHARMLLTETDAKVSSVALDSGFSSLSAFYEAFTKANGVTPAKYRSQALRSNPFIAQHSEL